MTGGTTPLAPDDERYPDIYNRRQMAESLNSWIKVHRPGRRARSYGQDSQHLDLLFMGIARNPCRRCTTATATHRYLRAPPQPEPALIRPAARPGRHRRAPAAVTTSLRTN